MILSLRLTHCHQPPFQTEPPLPLAMHRLMLMMRLSLEVMMMLWMQQAWESVYKAMSRAQLQCSQSQYITQCLCSHSHSHSFSNNNDTVPHRLHPLLDTVAVTNHNEYPQASICKGYHTLRRAAKITAGIVFTSGGYRKR